MENQLKKIIIKLPPIIKYKISREIDIYGFSYYLSKKLGLNSIPATKVGCPHGWHSTRYNNLQGITPLYNNIEGNIPYQFITKRDKYLVQDQNHVELFRKEGYTNIQAIGVPYIYIDDNDVKVDRCKNSLLVMPAHVSWFYSAEVYDETFVKAIYKIKDSFDLVVFCINGDEIGLKKWKKILKKYNFNWLLGAVFNDKNSLQRLNILFRSFEYMTSNSLGSHIPYASLSGCKVSFFGSYYSSTLEFIEHRTKSENRRDIHYARNVYEEQKETVIRERFGQFFMEHPKDGVTNIQWAKETLGYKYKRTYKELAKLLDWNCLKTLSTQLTDEKVKFSSQFNSLYQTVMDIKNNKQKCIIYGSGTIGKALALLLSDSFIAFIDKKSTKISKEINQGVIYSPENIKNMKYDCILVSALPYEDEVIEYLVKDLLVDNLKIQTIQI